MRHLLILLLIPTISCGGGDDSNSCYDPKVSIFNLVLNHGAGSSEEQDFDLLQNNDSYWNCYRFSSNSYSPDIELFELRFNDNMVTETIKKEGCDINKVTRLFDAKQTSQVYFIDNTDTYADNFGYIIEGLTQDNPGFLSVTISVGNSVYSSPCELIED